LGRAITKVNVAILSAVLILGALGVYYIARELPLANQNGSSQQAPLQTQGTTTSPTPTMTTAKSPALTATPTPIPSTTLTPTQTPTQATGNSQQLQLTLSIEKTSYSLGEPVNLTLTITNISSQTIDFTHTGLDFDFQVYNDTNNLVYQWSNFRAIAQFITIQPFSPGQSTPQDFTWSQACNFNESVQGKPVSAGTYYIVGLSSRTYGLQTSPIQITIVEL
jgi:hypothetical protein